MDRHAEREGERPSGDDPHPQAGEGSGTDPDHDPGDVGRAGARQGKRGVDVGGEVLRVSPRIERRCLGHHCAAIVQGNADCGRGRVDREEEHGRQAICGWPGPQTATPSAARVHAAAARAKGVTRSTPAHGAIGFAAEVLTPPLR